MKFLAVIVVIACFVHSFGFIIKEEQEIVYRGAVIEYEPYNEWTNDIDGSNIIQINAENIISYAEIAKDNDVDIFVAPEYGLQSLDMSSHNITRFLTVTQYVPDPQSKVKPCEHDSSKYSNINGMVALSCVARDLQMYLVIDMAERRPCNTETISRSPWTITTTSNSSETCPEHGFIFHNTQVVFDRTGTVVARYRKQNLYLEAIFSPGNEDDSIATFTTDFGVTFSLQICFDISDEHPGYNNVKNHGIKDVVMSTAWIDILPYFIAPSVQNGWSSALGVNLLVSGYHLPERAKLGSGIYPAYAGDDPVYTYDLNSGDMLLMSDVHTIADVTNGKIFTNKKKPLKQKIIKLSKNDHTDNDQKRFHLFFHDNLSNFSSVDLQQSTNGEDRTEHLCHENDDFCCTITYQANTTLNYKFVVYSGVIKEGNGTYQIYSQVCSVLWCKTDDIMTCGLVETGVPGDDSFGPATFEGAYESAVYPLGIMRDLTVWDRDQYKLEKLDDKNYRAQILQSVPNLLSWGMYGRWYARDPYYVN